MLTSLIVGLALTAGSPDFAVTKITGATVFRNEYGFVVMESPLSETGTTLLRVAPLAVEGTLWFAPGKGARIRELTVTWVDGDPVQEVAESIPELLALNVGQSVTVEVLDARAEKTETVSGKLLSISRGQALFETKGMIRAINFSSITALHGTYDSFKSRAETTVKVPALRVSSDPGTGGSIFTIALVNGMNWVPAYEIDLQDDGKLSLSMKATILNAIGDLDSIDVGLMSGFPRIEGLSEVDPLTNDLQAILTASLDSRRMALVRNTTTYGGGFGGGGFSGGGSGGFGGGTGDVPSGITRIAYDPSDNSLIVNPARDKRVQELSRNFASDERENFFIYAISGFEMKRDERKYMVIDEGEFDYTLVHKATSSAGTQNVAIQRFVSFNNELAVPLTKSSAVLRRGNELIGKAVMPYAYMKDKVELALGDAPYIKASSSWSIVSRNRSKLRLRDGRVFDEVVTRTVITATNLSSRSVDMLLSHSLRGDSVTATPDAETVRLATQDTVNFDHSIRWTIPIPPGGTQDFVVQYSTFVLTQEGT